ncbi:type II toxin-antitoxin system Phd/YefM family antitoxin [Leptospira sp. FAT2]|uniref:type II toxin-antitoxin system Phd/YefM family antitoxin n=1 Tax=Leptospira sanjuanensis TaxID=2879643 RepID=UPI001EE902F0|nr:type II toxin-antitoxin system Phd/YefM family antitoxin [Leptospira sanjuanensis]MCG6168816.1 type II toxin-antitoxin system Phd/YefM family antitoxin [Leptospira sanjuanensis]MCG6194230.1 type II toxin-antitoxin system Phd/YefM family antitoxin [Leptospira sanjuanensis]
MKEANIRDIQHNFSKILDWVEDGEEVYVLRRKKVVAKITSFHSQEFKKSFVPDFYKRAKTRISSAKGKSLSDLIRSDRDGRA